MKKLLLMLIFFITTGVAHEVLAMDNSDNNELNEIKRKILEFDAPELGALYFSEAQASYNNDLQTLEQTLINLKKINLISPSLYSTTLADYKELQEKVRNRFGQDIFDPRLHNEPEVQNMMQGYRYLQDIIDEEQHLRVFQEVSNVPVKYERKCVKSAINELKKPKGREKYFKDFRLAKMSSDDLERAILKNKMNRE